jgi:hypothetical protein
LRRNPDWLDKGVMDFHAIMEVPKGDKHAKLGHLPEIESFAKNDREKKLVAMWRGFRLVGSPYMLPRNADRVDVAGGRVSQDLSGCGLPQNFLKLVGDDAEPYAGRTR